VRVGFDHPRVGVVHERQAEAHTARERDGTPARHDVSDIHEVSPVQSIRCKINKTGDDVSTLIARTGVTGIIKNKLTRVTQNSCSTYATATQAAMERHPVAFSFQ